MRLLHSCKIQTLTFVFSLPHYRSSAVLPLLSQMCLDPLLASSENSEKQASYLVCIIL